MKKKIDFHINKRPKSVYPFFKGSCYHAGNPVKHLMQKYDQNAAYLFSTRYSTRLVSMVSKLKIPLLTPTP